jgi:hypothetical protein
MTVLHTEVHDTEKERLRRDLDLAERRLRVARTFLRQAAALDFPRRPDILPDAGTHEADCWRYHRDCLAVRALQLLG